MELLLNNPKDFELKEPPEVSDVDNFMCTLNRNVVSIATVKADGKGAYGRRGASKKCYYYNGLKCQEAHVDQENGFYINSRSSSSCTWKKIYVDKESIFFLKRHYRYNKHNLFGQMIVEVELYNNTPIDHYYVLYRWNNGEDKKGEILVARHGNARKPHTGIILI